MSAPKHYLETELLDLLQADEKIFDFLQVSTLDGLWYWDIENPEHEWMSPKFWETLGFDPSERKHLVEEWQSLIFSEDLALAIENFKRHCEDPSHPYDQIVRYRHANGSTVWVRCRGMAIRDENGKAIRMLGAHLDVTRLKDMEELYQKNLTALDQVYETTKNALEESEAIFQMSPDAMLQTNKSGEIVKTNKAAIELFGYSESELLSMSVDDLVPLGTKPHHAGYREKYMKDTSIRPMNTTRKDIYARHKSEDLIPVEIRLATIETAQGPSVLATVRDVTDTKQLVNSLREKIEENQRLEIESTTDRLTGVKNRRFFEEFSARAFENSQRHGHPLSVMMLDIDYFKKVNDTYGHDAGDLVLKEMSARIQKLVRNGDVFARIGGEEFCVLLPFTDLEDAAHLGERVRKIIEEAPFDISPTDPLAVTLSIGVSSLDKNDQEFEQVLKRSDEALYAAKDRGRNRVEVHSKTVEDE